MTWRLLFTLATLLPSIASAQTCSAPDFRQMPTAAAAPGSIVVRSGNMIKFSTGADLTEIVHGTGLIGIRYRNGARLTVTLDDGFGLRGLTSKKPGPFLDSALRGTSAEGCAFLKDWRQVQDAVYRSRRSTGGLFLYVFGNARDEYEFIALHAEKPDLVIRGAITGMSASEVEAVLSTVEQP